MHQSISDNEKKRHMYIMQTYIYVYMYNADFIYADFIYADLYMIRHMYIMQTYVYDADL